jgi:hypothetical protein
VVLGHFTFAFGVSAFEIDGFLNGDWAVILGLGF